MSFGPFPLRLDRDTRTKRVYRVQEFQEFELATHGVLRRCVLRSTSIGCKTIALTTELTRLYGCLSCGEHTVFIHDNTSKVTIKFLPQNQFSFTIILCVWGSFIWLFSLYFSILHVSHLFLFLIGIMSLNSILIFLPIFYNIIFPFSISILCSL